MKRSTLLVLVSLFALLGSAAVALGHRTPHSWSVVKARVMLQEGTNIDLPPSQKQALGDELEALLDKFNVLLLTAQSSYESTQNPEYSRLGQTYASYIDRFEEAQVAVDGGLSVDSVKCTGLGKALLKQKFTEKGRGGLPEKQYKHFRCNATSYVLEIASVELKPGFDPATPEVVEGARRLVGPVQAVFSVHVTGSSRMLSQRTG